MNFLESWTKSDLTNSFNTSYGVSPQRAMLGSQS